MIRAGIAVQGPLVPLYKRLPKWSDSKLETSTELKFESESETETYLTMYNETESESETSLKPRASIFRVRDERLGKFWHVWQTFFHLRLRTYEF